MIVMVLYARINENLEKKFRVKVAQKFGGQKGAIVKALEEAIKNWLQQGETHG